MENEFNERTNDEEKEFDTDTVNQVNESTIKNESNDSNKDGGELWIMLGIGVFLLLVFSIGFFVYYKRNTIPPSPVFPEADDGWIPLTPEENKRYKNEEETIDIPLASEFSDKDKGLVIKDKNEAAIIKDSEGETAVKGEIKSEDKETVTKSPSVTENTKLKPYKQIKEQFDEKETTDGSVRRNTFEKRQTQDAVKKNTLSTLSRGVEKKEAAVTVPKNGETAIAKNTSQNRTVQKIDKNNTSLDIKRYWIQVASLKSKKSADEARLELEKNKMPVNVFTYKGKDDAIYYRIRVGPYASKEEAEYWLRKISDIAFFKNEKCYVAGVE